MFAERAAKRERRPKRARAMVEDETPSAGQTCDISVQKYCNQYLYTDLCFCAGANQKAGKVGRKSVFDKELTNTSSKALKHYRAGWDCCLSVCLSLVTCLSAHLSSYHLHLITDLPSVTGSASVWTGSVLAAPGKPYLLSLDLRQSWDDSLSVLSFRFKKKWAPRWRISCRLLTVNFVLWSFK